MKTILCPPQMILQVTTKVYSAPEQENQITKFLTFSMIIKNYRVWVYFGFM